MWNSVWFDFHIQLRITYARTRAPNHLYPPSSAPHTSPSALGPPLRQDITFCKLYRWRNFPHPKIAACKYVYQRSHFRALCWLRGALKGQTAHPPNLVFQQDARRDTMKRKPRKVPGSRAACNSVNLFIAAIHFASVPYCNKNQFYTVIKLLILKPSARVRHCSTERLGLSTFRWYLPTCEKWMKKFIFHFV